MQERREARLSCHFRSLAAVILGGLLAAAGGWAAAVVVSADDGAALFWVGRTGFATGRLGLSPEAAAGLSPGEEDAADADGFAVVMLAARSAAIDSASDAGGAWEDGAWAVAVGGRLAASAVVGGDVESAISLRQVKLS